MKIIKLTGLTLIAVALMGAVAQKSINLVTVTGRTSTITGSTNYVDANDKYNVIVGYLKATNNGGTLPTLDAKIQYSPDCINWFDLGTFTQVTTVASLQNFHYTSATTGMFRCVRGVATLAGTNPDYDIDIKLYHD